MERILPWFISRSPGNSVFSSSLAKCPSSGYLLDSWSSAIHRGVKLDVPGIVKNTYNASPPPSSPLPRLRQCLLPQLEGISPSSAGFSLSLSPINFAFEISFVWVLSPLSTANPEGLALTPARLSCFETLLAEFPVSGLCVFNVFHTARPHSQFPSCLHLGGLGSKPRSFPGHLALSPLLVQLS